MGLSVEVTIDITDRSGPLLSSRLQHQYQQQRGTGLMAPSENLQTAPAPGAPVEQQPMIQP
jgi:hypothetical protein